MKTIVFTLFLLFSTTVFGQFQNDKLAEYYYSAKQYEKAVILYEDLHSEQPLTKYYNPLLNSYLFLERFKAAEKLVKRHTKKNPERLDLLIDEGFVYEKWGKLKKANKSYSKVIDEMLPNTSVILSIGNRLYKRGKYEYAIEAYEKGGKLLDGNYPFAFELAKVYEAQGNVKKVSESLIGVISFGEEYLEAVKNALSSYFTTDISKKRKIIFQRVLISQIQKNPDNNGFSDLLIWFYLQEKNFNAALIHSKAMDKRNDERGRRIIKLANICIQNQAYDVAIKSYEYILEQGDDSYYYRKARLDVVKVLSLKVEKDPEANSTDILALKNSYINVLSDLGENAYTIDLMIGYAHVLALYLRDTEAAKLLLIKGISLPRVKNVQRAKCKIELGDIYLMEDEVWEAALLYGQVNQDFKEDEIGHKAKLKIAKAYFYTGEFEWAKAQLDVLKASTTKLISNDAMQLSILISDNLSIDTSTVPLKMYAQAELYAYQNKDSLAQDFCDTLLIRYPENTTLLDDIYFLKASLFLKKKQWRKAIENYQKAVDYQDLLKDDALFKMGMIYDKILDEPEKAFRCFETIILEHGDSVYSIEARKHFRRLRGDKL
tara:strand:+ start:5520 stop:7325 length:1806 start_codon:yes stop_codon:yes gene_type:complete